MRADQRGSAVLEMPLAVGLLLIPFAVVVLTMPTWVERQTAARDAAGEFGRYLALHGPDGPRSIDEVVVEIERGYGLPPGSLRIDHAAAGGGPGTPVVVRVSIEIPAVVVPLFGEIGAVEWTAEHVERQPDYGATT